MSVHHLETVPVEEIDEESGNSTDGAVREARLFVRPLFV